MPLCAAPTAVEPCAALEPVLGRGGVWMKREDRSSRLYGGNKVRRYEFLLAELAQRGAQRIVTAGGIASTQVMATALFGSAAGMAVRAVLFDQPVTRFAREAILTSVSAGAELLAGHGYGRTAWRTWRALRAEKHNELLWPGASNALANLGYLDAMLELDAQVRAGQLPRPEVMLVPTGSAGTLAALALGCAWLRWDTECVGVRITSPLACNRLTVGRVLASTRSLLARYEPSAASLEGRFTLYGGALGPGYGEPTPEAVEGIALHERLVGVPGEVTYSGKALAALRALCKQERYARKTILLWNTLSSVRPPHAPDALERVPAELRYVFEREPVA